MPARWTIFCAMIDNFGDIGVCWRLACQLRQEHGIDVDLWVDDWASAGRFISAQQPALTWLAEADMLVLSGVTVLRWHKPWADDRDSEQRIAASDCVIEAFGCELPEPVKLALAGRQTPLVWINLEYLSAENWVPGCHGLPSPQHYSPLLKKFFFFPGFRPDTGGLLRETGLLEQHTSWQQEPVQSRQQLLATVLAGAPIDARDAQYSLVVSLFSYETPSVASWLQALSEGPDDVLCLVPVGRSLGQVASWLAPDVATSALQPGFIQRRDRLTVCVLPFMPQKTYDQLLSLCDFNLVRGEDSFVRAQWAARPFMWHIYPQHDGVHITKLQAFADCYLEGLDPAIAERWLRFAKGWNLGEDCREMWHYLRPQLPGLRLHTREWQKKLAVMPDLATNLVNFETLTKLSVSP